MLHTKFHGKNYGTDFFCILFFLKIMVEPIAFFEKKKQIHINIYAFVYID